MNRSGKGRVSRGVLEAIELYSEGSAREGSTKQSSNDGAVEVKMNSVSE